MSADITADQIRQLLDSPNSSAFDDIGHRMLAEWALARDAAHAAMEERVRRTWNYLASFPADFPHDRDTLIGLLSADLGAEQSQPALDTHPDPETPTDDGVALGEYPDLPPCTTGGRHLLSDAGRCARCGASEQPRPEVRYLETAYECPHHMNCDGSACGVLSHE